VTGIALETGLWILIGGLLGYILGVLIGVHARNQDAERYSYIRKWVTRDYGGTPAGYDQAIDADIVAENAK
jgi:hypothetical protein